MPSAEKNGRPEPAAAPMEPLAVRIPTAMQLIGVRRSTVYALIKADELRTVKVGRATLITMSSLRALVERFAVCSKASIGAVSLTRTALHTMLVEL